MTSLCKDGETPKLCLIGGLEENYFSLDFTCPTTAPTSCPYRYQRVKKTYILIIIDLCCINYAKIEKMRDKNFNRDFRIREKDRMAHFMIDDNRICHGIALLSDYRQIYNNQERFWKTEQSINQFCSPAHMRSRFFLQSAER